MKKSPDFSFLLPFLLGASISWGQAAFSSVETFQQTENPPPASPNLLPIFTNM
ncbi:MAG: hypothetical protein R2788_05485 [Saprospiraceae bacterium]